MRTLRPRLSSGLKKDLWIFPALVVGTFIRLFHLSSQIIGGDEMHTVSTALRRPLGWILTHYVSTDNCIPLTAFYRIQLDLGIRFSEMTFRLPLLILGIAFLIIVPLVLKDKIGRRPAIFLSWMIALAPLPVFYSRMVRPYAVTLLLSFGAVMCFFNWLSKRTLSAGVAYAVLSALSLYFHLSTAPFVLAPLAFFLIESIIRKDRDHRRYTAFLVISALTAGLTILILSPALPSLITFVTEKSMRSSVGLTAIKGFFHLFSGTSRLILTMAFWALCIWGFVRLALKRTRFALYCLFLTAIQITAIFVVSPHGISAPLVFSRYALVILPFVLSWLAFGLAEPWWKNQEKTGGLVQTSMAVIFILVLLLTGPLGSPRYFAGSFAHHTRHLEFYSAPIAGPNGDIPDFYKKLKEMPSGALIEYPWSWIWLRSNVFPAYQNVHRREVIVSGVNFLSADERVRFRNHIPMSPESFLSSRARFIIVHQDLIRDEEKLYPGLKYLMDFDIKRVWAQMRRLGADMSDRLQRLWGAPVYRDRFIRVWDLEEARDRQKRRAQGDGLN